MVLKILKLKSILFKVYGRKKYRDQRVNDVKLHQSRPIEFYFRDGNSFSSTPPLLKILVIVLLSQCKCEEEFEIVQKIEMIRGKRPERDHFFLDRNENEIAQEILFKWKCRFLVSKSRKIFVEWENRETKPIKFEGCWRVGKWYNCAVLGARVRAVSSSNGALRQIAIFPLKFHENLAQPSIPFCFSPYLYCGYFSKRVACVRGLVCA